MGLQCSSHCIQHISPKVHKVILNNIPLTQTRQPVFVQLLHHVYRVSQAVLGHQRVNVENCIKTLTEVGKLVIILYLSCRVLFHFTLNFFLSIKFRHL